MAIQNRRGNYGDFDKSKMLAGEFAIVLQDDPDTSDGKAVYMAFSPGTAKRLVTYEDLVSDLDIRKAGLFKQYFGVISDMFSGNVY